MNCSSEGHSASRALQRAAVIVRGRFCRADRLQHSQLSKSARPLGVSPGTPPAGTPRAAVQTARRLARTRGSTWCPFGQHLINLIEGKQFDSCLWCLILNSTAVRP